MDATEEYIVLIAKYLDGEADSTEQEKLFAWIKEDPQHEMIFSEYASIWHAQRYTASQPVKEWEIFRRNVQKRKSGNFVPGRAFLRVAALFLLIVLSVYAALNLFNDQSGEKLLNAGNEKKTFVLPDSSRITLSPGSVARVFKGFNTSNRHIIISGSARLQVSQHRQLPFLVEAGNLEVEVRGTVFYVSSGDELLSPTVILEEGKVIARPRGNAMKEVSLLPGQQASLSSDDKGIIIDDTPDSNLISWNTLDFAFEATPLIKVLHYLQKAYQITVELNDPALAACTITASFRNQNPLEILRVIAATLSLELKGSHPHYYLSGKPCMQQK